MTCRQCEMALAMEEQSRELQAHLAVCAACRRVAEELAANAEALRALGQEELLLASVQGRVMARIAARKRAKWVAALAAAAMLVVTLGLARQWPTSAVPPPPVKVAVDPPRVEFPQVVAQKRQARRPVSVVLAKAGPLVIKMLTEDPDVVIYWLVNGKEGIE